MVEAPSPSLKRSISRSSAILLVASGIIGSGIFKKIAPMADALHSPLLILACWAAAGLISLMGALCSAELGSMLAASGGEYVYFRRIYGRFFSFLYGWASFTVMRTCAIAALAQIFAESTIALFGLPVETLIVKWIGTGLVLGLSFVNHRGVLLGAGLSRVLIAGIILSILSFVVAAGFSDLGDPGRLLSASPNRPEGWALFSAIFAASLGAFWGYEGWSNIGYVGDEIRQPQRNLPIALGLGTLGVIILYLLMNAAYLYVMPVEDLAAIHQAGNRIAAVEVASVLGGPWGAFALSALIMVATFNCVNSSILMSARIFFAMAKDGLFPKGAGKVHPRYQTPSTAIAWQCGWTLVLLWWGNFDQLTDLLIFAAFMFYGATAVGVIILRRREPQLPRPYKVIGYPLLPILFAGFCLSLVVVTIIREPLHSAMGLGLILAGAPIYLLMRRRK